MKKQYFDSVSIFIPVRVQTYQISIKLYLIGYKKQINKMNSLQHNGTIFAVYIT